MPSPTDPLLAPLQHVLLVEDEPTIAVTLLDDLEENGYRVTHTGDGAIALRLVAEREFDAVITDLRLPGADGMQVIRAVAQRAPATRVLLITAFAGAVPGGPGRERVATTLEKPFCNSRVLSWLRKAE